MGTEVITPIAVQNYVTWSRSELIRAVDDARRLIGPTQLAQIASVGDALGGWEVNQTAETLNKAARLVFDITGARPTALELISLLNFCPSQR